MVRRLRFFFKQNYWRGLFVTGAVLEALAAIFWQSSPRIAGALDRYA